MRVASAILIYAHLLIVCSRNEDAERDCDAVLRLDNKNVKGHFRRGQARVALQKLHEAETGMSIRHFMRLSLMRLKTSPRRSNWTRQMTLRSKS